MPNRVTPAGRFASTDYPSYSHYNSLPGGMMCFITRTSNTGTFTGEATLSGFDTGTITTYANRLYRIHVDAAIQIDAHNVLIRLWLTDGSNNHFIHSDLFLLNAIAGYNQQVGNVGMDFLHSPGAGTRNYKVRGEIINNTAGVPFAACSATLIGYIQVEDVGPQL